MTIALRYSTRSDVGLVRANNQDSAFAGEQLLLVADGMGGHAGGDVASALCVASIAPLNNEAVSTSSMLERLGEAIERARVDLVNQARGHRSLAGMGTTVTALLLGENKLAMAHMGDSRGYLLRDGKLTQVTKDHTFVQHLVDAGKITPDEAETHPQRSVVMRVLGDFELDLVPDLSIREARPGDRWLLCSDGLSGFVRFETMEQTLRDVQDLELCSEYLIQLALRGGGSDNITCVVADIYETEDSTVIHDRELPAAIAVGSIAYGEDLPAALEDGGAASESKELLREAHGKVEQVILFAEARRRGDAEPQTQTGSLNLSEADLETAEQHHGVHSDDVDVDDVMVSTPSPRRGVVRSLINTLLVLILLGAAGYGVFWWGSQQYFLGVHQGKVAIFNGFPQSIGPVHLSSTVDVSDTPVTGLTPFESSQLYSTIRADSLADARERLTYFEDLVTTRNPEGDTDPATSTDPSTDPATEPEPANGDSTTDTESAPADSTTNEADTSAATDRG
ncbi:PP2C family protein-serine/threonine phosphatase [Jonesia quinghaiensis]|uniref:PP2C family protein-serine/threonine phosphatase n=1 Tax=Jonesia quinghaiensis TaxID=262806 RepID=UPI00041EE0B1|nr:PP2C family serine/threonine-protein phosphatase [Jonesia quinghaiensis]